MLQYDMFWSYISCLLADTIYYSATSFSFSVSTFLASFGVLPKLKLKRKMSTKPWCPLKVCKIQGHQLHQLLNFATEGKFLSQHLSRTNLSPWKLWDFTFVIFTYDIGNNVRKKENFFLENPKILHIKSLFNGKKQNFQSILVGGTPTPWKEIFSADLDECKKTSWKA